MKGRTENSVEQFVQAVTNEWSDEFGRHSEISSAKLRTALVPLLADAERLNWLEREGHSLMYYAPQKWDVGWGVEATPRAAIDKAIADPEDVAPTTPARRAAAAAE